MGQRHRDRQQHGRRGLPARRRDRRPGLLPLSRLRGVASPTPTSNASCSRSSSRSFATGTGRRPRSTPPTPSATGAAPAEAGAAAGAGCGSSSSRRSSSRSSRSSSPAVAGGSRPVPAARRRRGRPPPPSIDELRRQAGGALVQADDAVKTSEEELGFAVASYGEEATADFRAALDGAKAKVAEAFALQQQLDDARPDSDDERRAWYGGIIRLTAEADAVLDEQAEPIRRAPGPRAERRDGAEARAGRGHDRRGAHRAGHRPARDHHAAVRGLRRRPGRRQPGAGRGPPGLRPAGARRGRGGDQRGAHRAMPPSASARPRSRSTRRTCSRTPWTGSPRISPTADTAVAAGVADLEHDVQTGRALGDANAAALADRVAADAAAIRATMAPPDAIRSRPTPASSR